MTEHETEPGGADRTGGGLPEVDPRAAERSLRELVETLPGAIFRYLRLPDGGDRIDFISPGCVDLWEIDAHELHNDPTLLWAQVLPEDLPQMQASVARSSETLMPWLHRWRNVTPSGKLKWLEGRGQPVRLADGTTLWHTMIFDVTELEEARAQLTRREAELRALRTRLDRIGRVNAMGELTAAMAHEVNQPLSAIVNYLHAASDLLSDLDGETEMVAELVARADEQARRTAGIVARIRSLFTGGDVVKEPEDLNAVIAEAIDAALLETDGQITPARDFAPDLPPVAIDRVQIQQVVVNLLRNAATELAAHPAPRVTVSTARKGQRAQFCVEDNGRGVPEELQPDLFESFATGSDNGSGVGLSISASIVAAHGGQIRYEPAPEGGARFVIDLPVAAR